MGEPVPPDFVFRLIAGVNSALGDAACEARKRPDVARAATDVDIRGNEFGCELVAHVEIHSDAGPYVCLCFELGNGRDGWWIESSVDAAPGVGEPMRTIAERPTFVGDDLNALAQESVAAVAWLVGHAHPTDEGDSRTTRSGPDR